MISPEEKVILVDSNDLQTGLAGKMEAHRQGWLHRAFSVFLFNSNNELLLHQRAIEKYHSAGLWTNTCCSHPRPGESIEAAAHRRLAEEMGISVPLTKLFHFTYRAELEGGLIEHEFDHVFFGRYGGIPSPDPVEVADWKYLGIPAIKKELEQDPQRYTSWFRICFEEAVKRAGFMP
jgi:isopentenyl-diphosphate delta-isomerase